MVRTIRGQQCGRPAFNQRTLTTIGGSYVGIQSDVLNIPIGKGTLQEIGIIQIWFLIMWRQFEHIKKQQQQKPNSDGSEKFAL